MPVPQKAELPCVCATLRMATRSVTQFYDKVLRPSGLRATQFHILSEINARGAATTTALTGALVIDQTTLTRSLALLERSRLLRFAPQDDRRVKSIELTKKGAKALRAAQALWASAQENVLEKIGPATWAMVSGELDRLAHASSAEI